METLTQKGNIIEVVQKEVTINGKTKVFEFARRSPGTRIIVPQDGKILLTKEFRQELNGYDYRLPGGKVFDTLEEYNTALASGADITEAAEQAAMREAHEEIGYNIQSLSFFHKSICGTTVVWDLYYFVANDFTQTTQHLEEGEDITVELFDIQTVKNMCLNGAISEERSALVLLRYLQ
jgi:ADP-ribose pyrophosphatase